jgi:glutamate---cysteine ligase / carboxylate-amine ligase
MPSQTYDLSLGVEEEYQIIDPQTGALYSLAEPILHEASNEVGQNVQPEIHLSQLEIATPVCQTLAQVRSELQRLRHAVIKAAAHFDKEIAAAGAHPFARWQDQQMMQKERYLALEQRYQQFAREQSIFGCHVHVGISDRETAIQVCNHARIWLSPLLALSANSPFWWGTETGYASYRAAAVYAKWPQSGPPQLFSSLADYEDLTKTLITMKSIDSARNLYWDMRISELYPTVEVRIMDQCTTIDAAVMVAGLVRALVHTCLEQVEKGVAVPQVRQEILRFAHWQAARYGLDEELIDVCSGSAIPAGAMIAKFLNFVRPTLQAYGDWEEISRLVEQTLQQGNGAARQRAIYRNTGSLQAVVSFLVVQTAAGITEEDMTFIQ